MPDKPERNLAGSKDSLWRLGPVYSQSDRTLARLVARPVREFLRVETAGSVVLLAAALVALIWANSPWSSTYDDLWHTVITLDFGPLVLEHSLQDWVNDALMVIFFFVVGLEIKRELVEGELRGPRRAVLPAVAALGGMVVPALIYVAFNAGGDGAEGWGIPMATDIAMAVGILSLLGSRVAPSLKLFLLALAIVDDIGAIAVIAIFYTDDIDYDSLLIAMGLVVALVVMRLLDVRTTLLPLVVGGGLWLALHEAGLHATIAGVILGLMAPTRPHIQPELVDETALTDLSSVAAARQTATMARQSVSVVEWLEHVLHPWSSFVIVPLFALANAGVTISSDALSDAVTSRIALGVLVGLVVGKLAGITAFTWLATRLGIGVLPEGATWRGITGVAAVAGIGFTVSLFISSLAFDDVALQDEAKIGILAAAVVSGALGALVLGAERPRSETVRAQKSE
jgi:Na+:H+ antiporter, NhaA family